MRMPNYIDRGHVDSSLCGQSLELLECAECGVLLHRDARQVHNLWHLKIYELLEYPARAGASADIRMEEPRYLS